MHRLWYRTFLPCAFTVFRGLSTTRVTPLPCAISCLLWRDRQLFSRFTMATVWLVSEESYAMVDTGHSGHLVDRPPN